VAEFWANFFFNTQSFQWKLQLSVGNLQPSPSTYKPTTPLLSKTTLASH